MKLHREFLREVKARQDREKLIQRTERSVTLKLQLIRAERTAQAWQQAFWTMTAIAAILLAFIL